MMEYTEVRLLEIAKKIIKMLDGYGDTRYKITKKNGVFYLIANNGGINTVETRYIYMPNLVSDLVDRLYILKIEKNEG